MYSSKAEDISLVSRVKKEEQINDTIVALERTLRIINEYQSRTKCSRSRATVEILHQIDMGGYQKLLDALVV
jgi:hypothetical protein